MSSFSFGKNCIQSCKCQFHFLKTAFFLSMLFLNACIQCNNLMAFVPDDFTSKIKAIEAGHRQIEKNLASSDWVFTMRLDLSHDELIPWHGKQYSMVGVDTTVRKKLGNRRLLANGITQTAIDQNGKRLEDVEYDKLFQEMGGRLDSFPCSLTVKNPTLYFDLSLNTNHFDFDDLTRNRWIVREMGLSTDPDYLKIELDESLPWCGTKDLGGTPVIEWMKGGSIISHKVENGIDYFELSFAESTIVFPGGPIVSARVGLDSTNSWAMVYSNLLRASGVSIESEVTYAPTPIKGVRWPISGTWKTGDQNRRYDLDLDFDARAKSEEFELPTYGFPNPKIPSFWSRYWIYALVCGAAFAAWMIYWFRRK